jgi:hypothetical protein
MGEGMVITVALLIALAVVVSRVGRVNQQALEPTTRRRRDRRDRRDRRGGAARARRSTPSTEVQRPGLDDRPRGVTAGVYVLEVRHRRAERGDVDYLKIGGSADVAAQIRAHQEIEGNNLQVYGIAWTTDHASLEAQVHQDLRPWLIEAPGVTAVELYEPAPEVYKRLEWLWR